MKHKMKEKLNWEIEVSPIPCKVSKKVLGKLLTRSDNGAALGIRSKNYHPVYNRDLEKLKKRIVRTGAFTFKGYEVFGKGKRILAFFENNRKNLQICGEPVQDYLIIGNSNDASSKLFVGTSNYMWRCQNQFSEKIRSFEHIHNSPFRPKDIRIEGIIETYEQGRRELYEKMEHLKKIPADMDIIQQLAIKLLVRENQNDRLENPKALNNSPRHLQFLKCIELEMKDLQPTLWGVFNGVTRYTSNHLKGNPGFGVVNGLGERLNREALTFLLKV